MSHGPPRGWRRVQARCSLVTASGTGCCGTHSRAALACVPLGSTGSFRCTGLLITSPTDITLALKLPSSPRPLLSAFITYRCHGL
eukprot:5354683-Pleurochrysis_carterae.AAC.1